MTTRATAREYSLSAIDIPSISIAMSIMKTEISKASLAILRMQEASDSLEQAIRNASLVTSRNEIGDGLKLSTQNLIVAMSTIEEEITLLQETLSKNTVIPDTILSAK